MKKTRFLALALVVAIALMGAGYAWWTDLINYKSTISTGELEMTLMDGFGDWNKGYGIMNKDGNLTNIGEGKDNVVVVNPVFDLQKKSVAFEFKNLYPGTRATTVFRIKNTGSVPVTLKDVEVDVETTDEGPDGVSSLENKIDVSYSISIREGSTVKTPIGVNKVNLNGLQASINSLLSGQVIYPQQELVLGPDVVGDGQQLYDSFMFLIDRDGDLVGNEGELETVKVEVKFNFIQANAY